jgi:hypothetical protein
MSDMKLTTSHILTADFWARTPCSPPGGYHSSGRTVSILRIKVTPKMEATGFSEMLVIVS